MTLNDREPQNRGFSDFCFSRFHAATHISRVNCAEITGYRPRQPAYEIKLMLSRDSWAWAHIFFVCFCYYTLYCGCCAGDVRACTVLRSVRNALYSWTTWTCQPRRSMVHSLPLSYYDSGLITGIGTTERTLRSSSLPTWCVQPSTCRSIV